MRPAFSFLFLTYRSERITQIQCLKEFGDQLKWALSLPNKDDYQFSVQVSMQGRHFGCKWHLVIMVFPCFITKFKPNMRGN